MAFYDQSRIAIMPIGLCYPGRNSKGGDAPPRSECAPAWHARVLAALPGVELTLLVGGYAQRYYLGDAGRAGVGATVANWREHPPTYLPLPHPNWRTRAWVAKRPWFECALLSALRHRIAALFTPR